MKEMESISHQQAKEYLLKRRKGQLASEREALANHLAACEDCQQHSDDLDSLAITLSETFHAHWDHKPAPRGMAKAVHERFRRAVIGHQVLKTAGSAAGVLTIVLLGLGINMLLTDQAVPLSGDTRATNTHPYMISPGEILTSVANNKLTHTPQMSETAIPLISTPSPTITENGANFDYYDIQAGDTIFGIADKFGLFPESVLSSNINLKLHALIPGTTLRIPPDDGLLYTWVYGDSLSEVAWRFDVNVGSILNWPGNNLNRETDEIQSRTVIFVPGGMIPYMPSIGPIEKIMPEDRLMNDIAFMTRRDRNPEIYLMDTDGEGQINLTLHPANDYYPTWSPDGKELAFFSDRTGKDEIFIIDLEHGAITQLTDFPGAMAYLDLSWSSDGKIIAAAVIFIYPLTDEGYSQIYAIRTDGSGAFPVTQTESPLRNYDPKWSPAEELIAYRHLGVGRTYLKAASPFAAEEFGLTEDMKNDASFTWSPDGSKLAYFSSCVHCELDWSLETEIRVVNADGSGMEVLYNLDHLGIFDLGLSWSPDGAHLLLWAGMGDTGEQALYLFNADGSGIERLAGFPVNDLHGTPSWSPDGKQIIYSSGEGQDRCIYIMDIAARLIGGDGDGISRISCNDDDYPQWRP